MVDGREKGLPRWAQELLGELRARVASATEPLIREVAAQRPRIQLLEREVAALKDLVTCAAKGGHRTCQEIVDVYAGYSLTLAKNE